MANADLEGAVRANVVETVSGLILVVGGAALNLFLEGSSSVRFVGYVVSTVGTLLISWALTRAWVARQHEDLISRSLRAIVRPLSTTTSQLNQAVYRSVSGGTSVQTELLESSVQHLFGVLSELQLLIGSPISIEDVVAIKGRLDTLGEELAAAWPEEEEDTEGGTKARVARALEEVQGIKLQLDSALIKGRVVRQETVECLSCRQKVTTGLGSFPGDSAMVTCGSCNARLHVHRGVDGVPFARTPGGAGRALGSVYIKRDCPRCQHVVPVTVPREGAGLQVRFCLNCFSKLRIDPNAAVVEVLKEPESPLTGVLQHLGALTMVICPLCQQTRRSMANRDGAHYAVCPSDDRLVMAKSVASAAVLPNQHLYPNSTPGNPPPADEHGT